MKKNCVHLSSVLSLTILMSGAAFGAATDAYDRIITDIAAMEKRVAADQARLTDVCSLADYRGRVRKAGDDEIWTDALQTALDEHAVVRIPDGRYLLDATVRVKSGRRIEAGRAHLVMREPMDTAFLVNANAATSAEGPVDRATGDANIAVTGGVWEDWRRTRASEGVSGKGGFAGASALFYFSNVKGLSFRDVTLFEAGPFGIQVGDAEDVVCENLSLENCHADGFHVNGGVKNVLARNIHGDAGDDLVALNFHDWPCSSANFGPGDTVLVEHLRSGKGARWFRLLPGVKLRKDGTKYDCPARNVIVRDVKGVNEFKMYMQTQPYRVGAERHQPAEVGHGENIWFEDLEIACNPRLPPFEIGANLTGVHLRHLTVRFPKDSACRTLVRIGPKSEKILFKGRTYEVFDPWVSCTVRRLSIEDVDYPDGGPAKEVDCVVFDDLHKDGDSSGRGTLVFGDRTFCNPLSLPDCPNGCHVANTNPADDVRQRFGAWREVGDPAVIRENGVWYLYASGGENFCWKSADDGATWETVHLSPATLRGGYAPTVVKHRGKFLMCTGWGGYPGRIYSADRPEGPFALLGTLTPPSNDGAQRNVADAMLFSDEDGKRLYFYWGCSRTNGVWGCELDAANPTRVVSPAKRLVAYDPKRNPWEKFPVRSYGFVEGAWLFKRDGGYYLVFAAGGTEFPTYATGLARADSPLGDFTLQPNNPVFRTPKGLVTGTAHGAVAQDEHGDWWYFYTVHSGIRHQFERRIGMDRIAFDANGDMIRSGATSEPQLLPSAGKGAAGWHRIRGMTLMAHAAFDDSMETEFVPNRGLPYELEFEFEKAECVRANRVLWSDGGLDPAAGVNAGPIRYRVSLQRPDGTWATALDASANDVDRVADYREMPPIEASAARLTVLGAPKGILPRIVEWTLFGGDRP